MSYSEQIRHPDGALNPPAQQQDRVPWFWILLAVAVLAYFGWRAGAGWSLPSSSPANPNGWV